MSSDPLEYRLKKATLPIPSNSLDRSRMLKSLTVTRNKLVTRQGELKKSKKIINREIQDSYNQLKVINQKIKELCPDEGTIVTEHALLRAVERYLGIDLEMVHSLVLNLPDSDKIISHNTVITVFPDESDHFNLAQNESN